MRKKIEDLGFNPLKSGHQLNKKYKISIKNGILSFNPLKSGHQLNYVTDISKGINRFNPLKSGHQLNSKRERI